MMANLVCRSVQPMTCSRGAILRSKLDFDLHGFWVRGKQTFKGFLWQDLDSCSGPFLGNTEGNRTGELMRFKSRTNLTHCSPLGFFGLTVTSYGGYG